MDMIVNHKYYQKCKQWYLLFLEFMKRKTIQNILSIQGNIFLFILIYYSMKKQFQLYPHILDLKHHYLRHR